MRSLGHLLRPRCSLAGAGKIKLFAYLMLGDLSPWLILYNYRPLEDITTTTTTTTTQNKTRGLYYRQLVFTALIEAIFNCQCVLTTLIVLFV